MRIATASLRTGLAMTWFLRGVGTRPAGGQGRPPLRKRYKGCDGRATARVAPTEGYKRARYGGPMWASAPTDDNEICASPGGSSGRPTPYESVTRGSMGGRPQGSPLRRITRGCGTADRCRRSPLRDHFGFIYIGKFIFPRQKRKIHEYIV